YEDSPDPGGEDLRRRAGTGRQVTRRQELPVRATIDSRRPVVEETRRPRPSAGLLVQGGSGWLQAPGTGGHPRRTTPHRADHEEYPARGTLRGSNLAGRRR